MKPEIPLKGGNEQDCLTGWRRVLKLSSREIGTAKKSYRKRIRHFVRSQLKEYTR